MQTEIFVSLNKIFLQENYNKFKQNIPIVFYI